MTVLLTILLGGAARGWAQNATLSGVIRDPNGGSIPGARLELSDQATGIAISTTSNDQGVYVFWSLRPSTYQLIVQAPGFAVFKQNDLVLFVDARLAFNATLSIAAQTETVEVSERPALLGTTDGSVGTVIDREFAARLPTRGRSFSAMIALAPGVSRAGTYLPAASSAGSEFSVNGQRDTANSLFVDGVSGMSELGQAGLQAGAGTRLAATQTGTVNGGVSLDAVQEIHIQTSSFAAEFGRTPGAQIALVTRSGSNRFTGTLFEQFRNEKLMANDWFANRRGAAKPDSEEHQFGGTLGGPILSNRLFFFGSYEGLRLHRPRFQTITVPSLEARGRASAVRDVLALYPAPNGPADGLLASYGAYDDQRYESDTLGIRADAAIRPGMQTFVRYARTPSNERNDQPIPSITEQQKLTSVLTASFTATLSNRALFEVRGAIGESTFDYLTETNGLQGWFPSGLPDNGRVAFSASGLPTLIHGGGVRNVLRQSNVVSAFSYLWGNHQLKTGLDYRRMAPVLEGVYTLTAQVQDLQRALDTSQLDVLSASESFPIHGTFQNVSFYGQDGWRVHHRLTLTYGVRWDINPTPTFASGEGPLAASVFEPIDRLTMSTRQNTRLWKTNYGNLFPRLGFAYSVDQQGSTQLSGGYGIFGDLEGAATGNGQFSANARRQTLGLPLTSADVVTVPPPTFTLPLPLLLTVADPNLETPRTTQWNVTLQRQFGARYALSAGYVGAKGDHLLTTHFYQGGASPSFSREFLTMSSTGRSSYHSLQLQFRGRPAKTVNVLASYTLGQAKDTSSTASIADAETDPGTSQNDVRHVASLALTWTLPTVTSRSIGWLANNWDVDVLAFANSAYPLTFYSAQALLPTGPELLPLRAAQIPGLPEKVDDPTAPGGWRFNKNAFVEPPPGQQGNTRRNQFRGFSKQQVDLGLQRTVALGDLGKLRVRVDVFNLFNTPVFAQPWGYLGPLFGQAQAMASANIAALYQPGGARTASLSLRFQF